jgi:uncharacterized membrane protein
MPSPIDAYVHTDMDGLHDALKFGVTTELEMMGRWSAKQRKEISERNDVADLRSPGMGVTPREGHPTEYMSSSNNGSITLKIGLKKVDTFTAAAIRVTMATLVLTTVAFSRKPEERPKLNTYGTRNLLLVASAGLLTYDIGAIGYVTVMNLIGAGKTTLLSASAPIFLPPMSVLILKERLSPIALAGVCVAVAGICLVAI